MSLSYEKLTAELARDNAGRRARIRVMLNEIVKINQYADDILAFVYAGSGDPTTTMRKVAEWRRWMTDRMFLNINPLAYEIASLSVGSACFISTPVGAGAVRAVLEDIRRNPEP